MKLSIFGPFGVADFFLFLFGSLFFVGLGALLPPLPVGGTLKPVLGRIYVALPVLILFIFFVARDGETKQPLHRALLYRFRLRRPAEYRREG